MMNNVSRIGNKFWINITAEETKAIHIEKDEKPFNIVIYGKTLEQVKSFRYVGSLIT